MTPEERRLLDELFGRLATLERAPRDPEAVAAINEGLRRAPNALYPLVQTVLLQDEALKRADVRIRELEAGLGIDSAQPAQQQEGFLDSMRDALFGRRESQQGSVPSVRGGSGGWNPLPSGGQPMGSPPLGAPQRPMPGQDSGGPGGGSFLGTAAAAAAGVVGGALLMNSLGGLFGGKQGQAQGAFDGSGAGSPWGGGNSGGDLARQAGLDDIRGSGAAAAQGGGQERYGAFDSRAGEYDTAARDIEDDGSYESDFDFGGDSDFG